MRVVVKLLAYLDLGVLPKLGLGAHAISDLRMTDDACFPFDEHPSERHQIEV